MTAWGLLSRGAVVSGVALSSAAAAHMRVCRCCLKACNDAEEASAFIECGGVLRAESERGSIDADVDEEQPLLVCCSDGNMIEC